MENRRTEEDIHLNYSIVKEEYCVVENGVNPSESEAETEEADEELPNEERLDEDAAEAQEVIQFEITEIEQTQKPKHEQLMCLICEETFAKLPALKAHMLTHTNSEAKNTFKCPHCPLTFDQKYLLDMHQRTHQVTDVITPGHGLNKEYSSVQKRSHKCQVCSKSFIKASHLKRHFLIHLRGMNPEDLKQYETQAYRESPLQCPICFTRFKKQLYLKKHMSIHSNDKPFDCKICGKAFRRKDYVKNHMKIAHEDQAMEEQEEQKSEEEEAAEQPPPVQKTVVKKKLAKKAPTKSALTCKICEKVFKNTITFNRHAKKHAEPAASSKIIKTEKIEEKLELKKPPVKPPVRKETPKSPKPKKKSSLACGICEKVFTRESNYLNHVATHRSDRPFECDQCDAKFKRKDHLQGHMETHNANRKTYTCKVCGQAFFWMKSLMSHELTHKKTIKSVKCPRCKMVTFNSNKNLNRHLKTCKPWKNTKNAKKVSLNIKMEME